MKMISLFLLLAAGLSLTGCARHQADELTVYCAAGLLPPVQELLDEFSTVHAVPIKTIPSGSNVLLAQISNARRGDVYVPGDQFYMDQAADRGFILSQKPIAYFIPVIAVHKGTRNVHTLADLARPDLRVGLGEPQACAVGRTSRTILEKQGLFDKVKPRYTALTVNDLGNQLKLGHIDAAILWDAVARFYPDDVDIVSIPPDQGPAVPIPAGVLSFTTRRDLAAQLVDFLASEHARQVFVKHGYTVTPPTSGK